MPKFITSLGILRGSHSLKKYSSNDREYFSDVYHLNSEILEKAQLYLDRIKDIYPGLCQKCTLSKASCTFYQNHATVYFIFVLWANRYTK